MWPDRISNPGPLAHESDALPTTRAGTVIMLIFLLDICDFWRKTLINEEPAMHGSHGLVRCGNQASDAVISAVLVHFGKWTTLTVT